ncbi:MAG: hypothetical protein KAY22_05555 [Rhizorhabdus sp.]|uniref:hypothetical protein n=1 Tax=Rhizorhabdus sp. TaxID=1968843 RepID=UPI001B6E0C3B|nr:hypothetical protein [Rhizorhabdus sp.]MBP8231751.1 hypothetical protein [Rhizorhabdus sp.]
MSDFGTHALFDGEFQMSTDERIEQTLTAPGSAGAMPVATVNKITLARIRAMLANASADLYPELLTWIRQTAADSPARAVELYLELLQFSVPKQKAVAVAVQDNSDNPRKLSLSELYNVVSEQ